MWCRDFVRLQFICLCAPWETLTEYKHSTALLHSTRIILIAVSVEDEPPPSSAEASCRTVWIMSIRHHKRTSLPCSQFALFCLCTDSRAVQREPNSGGGFPSRPLLERILFHQLVIETRVSPRGIAALRTFNSSPVSNEKLVLST